MSDLKVDTDALREAADQLTAAASFAEEARSRGGRLHDLTSSAGGQSAGAVENFLHEWTYGLRLIGDDAKILADTLVRAATAFESVEARLSNEAR